jgi:AcrR family transcriptional regulator
MRIVAATVHLASEHGVQAATVSHIVDLAGVSRKTFYGLFEDRGDCLLAAIEQSLTLARERASVACEAHERWVDRVRAGLFAVLQLLDEEPKLARLCVVQWAAAGPAALARRSEVLDQLAQLIDEGRESARRQPLPLTAEGVVGGVLGVIHARLLRPGSGALVELLNPLMSMIALPYLGGAAARRELSRPAPPPREVVKSETAPNLLHGLSVRLTYRTLTVLEVVADEPGLSNCEIGERAGITDQGQISRLLARLARVGLLENTGGGQAKGTTNAWRLALRGKHVERAIRDARPSAPGAKGNGTVGTHDHIAGLRALALPLSSPDFATVDCA